MGIASTPALSGLSRHWGTEILLLEGLTFRGGASGLMLQVPQRWVCLPPYQPHSSASLCDTWDQHLRQHHHRLSQGGHTEFAQWTCWLPDAQNGLPIIKYHQCFCMVISLASNVSFNIFAWIYLTLK